MRIALAAFVGVLAAPGLALAYSASIDEPEIVVTAPLEGSRIESLQGAAVLDRDEIAQSLNGGLGDTLERLPGIASTFYGAGASRPIIRGLGDDRVRVLENGIGAIDASSASPDHAVSADGLDAGRIEVLRGAAALAYGGNAIGGVVNVIDESIPARAPGDGVAGNALAGYTSGNAGGQMAVGVTAGEGPLVFHVAGAARTTDDYETPLGQTPNSYTEYRTLSGGGSYVGALGHVGLAVKRTESEYGLPPEDASEPGGHIELEQDRIELRGDVRLSFGPFDRLDFAAQSADYQHTEFEGDGEAGTQFLNEGYEARAEAHHHGFGDKLDGAIGVQIIDSDFSAVGEEAFIAATNTRDLGLFAVERLDFGGWGLEGGLRYETRKLDNADFGGLDFDTLSGSFGAFVRPVENWFLGATLARTERAPTAIELFANGPHLATAAYEVGGANLDVETATSFEMSARYSTEALSLELNIYRINFSDYIALLATGDTRGDLGLPADPELDDLPVFAFAARDASFTGGELSAKARLFDIGALTFSADGAYDLVRASFEDSGRPPRIPPQTLTLGLSGESDAWSGRVEWVDTADQDRVADFESATEGNEMINASLAFRPLGEDGPLTFLIDGRNLTDELARAHTSFLKDELPLPGRSVRVAVTARL